MQLIHVHYMGLTTSVVLLREGVKYHQKCKVSESYMTLQTYYIQSFICLLIDKPSFKLTDIGVGH